MTINKQFNPTAEMISAAETVFLAKAYVELVKPIVIGYRTKILAENDFFTDQRWVKGSRRLGPNGPIRDQKDAYLMSQSDFAIFDGMCHEARRKAKLYVSNEDHCPLCVAETDLMKAKKLFCDAIAPVTGMTYEVICVQKMEVFEQYFELGLKLFAPFVRAADEIMADVLARKQTEENLQ